MISIPIIATVILGIFILLVFAAAILNMVDDECKARTTNTLFILCVVFGLFIAGYWILYYCK